MKRIFAGIAAAVLAAGACFALAACERKPLKVKTSLETGWTVENMVLSDETEVASQAVIFSVSRGSQDICDMWVNVGSITPDTVTLTVCSLTSSSATTRKNEFTYELSRKELKDSTDGWVKIKSGWNVSNSYVSLETKGGVELKEVVFVNNKGVKQTATVSRVKNFFYVKDGKTYGVKDETSFSEFDSAHNPSNLVDEQDKFDKK